MTVFRQDLGAPRMFNGILSVRELNTLRRKFGLDVSAAELVSHAIDSAIESQLVFESLKESEDAYESREGRGRVDSNGNRDSATSVRTTPTGEAGQPCDCKCGR